MALGKIFFLFFTALVAVNIVFADDSASSSASASTEVRSSDDIILSLFPSVVTCNYTATPGSYCASCRQAVRCLPSGNGILVNCFGLLPYCYAGRCSFLADPVACNRTSSG